MRSANRVQSVEVPKARMKESPVGLVAWVGWEGLTFSSTFSAVRMRARRQMFPHYRPWRYERQCITQKLPVHTYRIAQGVTQDCAGCDTGLRRV